MEFIIKINSISHLIHIHILMKASVISRKNMSVWAHYAELAVISGLRILKSLKEANSGDERL